MLEGSRLLSSSIHLSELVSAPRAPPWPLARAWLHVYFTRPRGCLGVPGPGTLSSREDPKHGPGCQSLSSSVPVLYARPLAKEKQRQAALPTFSVLGTGSWSSLFPGLAPPASNTRCTVLSPCSSGAMT